MSRPSVDAGEDADEESDPRVPPEVLEAIDNLEAGETASKEDIESVLKF